MPELHAELSEADVAAWIAASPRAWADRAAFHFAIARGAGGEPDEFLGGVNLIHFNWAHRFANVSYWVRAGATGRGVATAATRLVARFAFERLALNRLEILMAPANSASRRVAEKTGAKYEGLLRRRIACHGIVHDAHLFALVPSDLNETGLAT
jgi:RimJ/RimL family protein N-acetyltransferase